eukprot:5175470-Lingulodinium_polyedra.AAC.1
MASATGRIVHTSTCLQPASMKPARDCTASRPMLRPALRCRSLRRPCPPQGGVPVGAGSGRDLLP